jgi:competence protein ComEA
MHCCSARSSARQISWRILLPPQYRDGRTVKRGAPRRAAIAELRGGNQMSAKRILTIVAILATISTMAFAQSKDSKEPAKAPAPATKSTPPAPAPAAQPAAKPAPAAPAAKAATPAAAPAAKKVNLNTATADELDGLPQIGPARAKAIIEARGKAKFKNWDDFVARNVVPGNAESAIKSLVSF